MITVERFSEFTRTGYSSDGRSYRICHHGEPDISDANDASWFVMQHRNTIDSFEMRKVFTGVLQDCIDYVNSVSEFTD